MSDTEKRPYAQVMRVAEVLIDSLRPACHRIEVAGSLRRQKERVGDIEIVAIPKPHTNLLGEPLDSSEVDDWFAGKPVALHKNGQKYKAFSFEWQPGWTFKVDLFLPNHKTWAVVYTLRTGSSEFSKRMVTMKGMGGYMPPQYRVQDGRVWSAGMLIETPEEEDIFARWGMEFVVPKDRL